MNDSPAYARDPASVDELRLPPTFVAEHCIRTLAYNGAMTSAELSRHWRVPESLAADIGEALKSAGLLEVEAGHRGFERLGRLHLTARGEARVEAARRRTWYAGPLPVGLAASIERMRTARISFRKASAEEALTAINIPARTAAELGQAAAAAATIALAGVAHDEQEAIAGAIAGSLTDEVDLPYAIFAAGSVMRMFDPRWHRGPASLPADDEAFDILRPRQETLTQWVRIFPPSVVLSGGIHPSDVSAAFDDEARFYIAPPSAAAHGGLLSVLDADGSSAGISALADRWLIPGRNGTGVIVLRTGERIELAWRATTLLMSETPINNAALASATPYRIDLGVLGADDLTAFVERRLGALGHLAEEVGAALAAAGVATRPSAARSAHYIGARATYEGSDFRLTNTVLDAAIATNELAATPPRLLRAAS